MNRRQYLSLLGSGSLGFLAGCQEGPQDTTTRTATETTSTPTTTARETTTTTEAKDTETTIEEPERDLGPMEFGAVYIPFMGDKWEDCAVGTPAIGEYTDTADSAVVSTHIDQMTSNNIPRVLFNFGEEHEDYQRWRDFTRAPNFSEVEIECYYVISQALRRDRDITKDFEFIRQNLLPLDNYRAHEGRPVIQFWDVRYLVWGGNEESSRVKEKLLNEWGDITSFFEFVREELTLNGTPPYMIGDFKSQGIDYRNHGLNEHVRGLLNSFDAAATWTGHTPPNQTYPWEKALPYVQANFEGYMELVEEFNIDFVPTVFPGFDDRENDCWGENRHVPRSQEKFRAMIKLADEYRTTDMVNIATWNGWNEGHQIEPGSHQGEQYGNAFLEITNHFTRTE